MNCGTKTVLGRVFTLKATEHQWECKTKLGLLTLRERSFGHVAALHVTVGFAMYESARGEGPTEADAILALQSTLRKMAELEVES